MAITTYKGIKVPGDATDTINSGTSTVGGILIDNDKNLADRVTTIEAAGYSKWSHGVSTPDANVNGTPNELYLKSNGVVYAYTVAQGASTGTWGEFTDLKGPAGVSPTITMSTQAVSGGNTITFTAGSNTQSLTVLNGTTPTISSAPITGGNRLTIQNGGTSSYIDVMNGSQGSAGLSVTSASINGSGHLILTMSDTTTLDAGAATGPQGPAGASSFTASTSSSGTPSFEVSDGASLQCTSSALTSVTVSEPASGWTFGKYSHLYFVSSATPPTFACPVSWCCKGDDCSEGEFTPSASTTYDLFIFKTVDTTVITVMGRN